MGMIFFQKKGIEFSCLVQRVIGVFTDFSKLNFLKPALEKLI
jgi:hypothetical protein